MDYKPPEVSNEEEGVHPLLFKVGFIDTWHIDA
jgi:hypothetical protein